MIGGKNCLEQNVKIHSVKYNFMMSVILKVSSFVFPLITLPYITRTLGAVGNGKVAFVTSVINYFVMLSQLGIPTYGIRACAKCRDNKDELTKTVQELLIINTVAVVASYILLIAVMVAVPKFREEPAFLIKNPVDTVRYKIITPLECRPKHSIAFLYHEKPHKGFKYAYEVILKLRAKYPDLSVEVFGVYTRPKYFPSFIKYTKSASQQQTIEIYNKSAVFLCATVAEGYGLTGLEAMACGASLASTDYQGVHEYAIDGVNALLSSVKDVDALVANVSRLFDEDELRYRIAKAGVQSVQ